MPNEQNGIITMTFVDTENREKFMKKFEEHEAKLDGEFCYPLDATRGGGIYIGCASFELVGTDELKLDCVFRGGFYESTSRYFGYWLAENRIFMLNLEAYWFDLGMYEHGSSSMSAYEEDEFFANKHNPEFELGFSTFDGEEYGDMKEFVVEHFSKQLYDDLFSDDEDSDVEYEDPDDYEPSEDAFVSVDIVETDVDDFNYIAIVQEIKDVRVSKPYHTYI